MKVIVDVGAADMQVKKDATYYTFDIREDVAGDQFNSENVNHYNTGLYSDNTTIPLYVTKKGQCSSIYEPDLEVIKEAGTNPERFTVVRTIEVVVARMDSILPSDLKIDYLKIDTQGSELDVLKGAGDLLYNVAKVECEVEFIPLYKGQPLFEDVKEYLQQYGFTHTGYKRQVSWKQGDKAFADAIFVRK